MNLGDTVVIAPGIYFETVRLRRFGTEKKPVTFRADRIQKNRVVISGADPAIRLGKRSQSAYLKRPAEELYDLTRDPDELVNLAARSLTRLVMLACGMAVSEVLTDATVLPVELPPLTA